MSGLWSSIRARVAPPIPDEISDDFAQLRSTRLREKARLLYFALLMTVPTTIYGAAPGAHPAIRIGIPLVMATACLLGFLALLKPPEKQHSVRISRRLVRRAAIDSSVIAILCSSWSVFSWFGASPGTQLYYPMILTMGSLATAYCLSMIRLAAVLNIVIGIGPVLFLLVASGTRMDLVFANSLLLCSGFMIHMIISQHDQLAEMLMMQRKMQRLAETDPLTGLANRRVLADRIEALTAPGADYAPPFALALLDLDGFKPVNDRLGHAAGDELLIAIGARLTDAAGPEAIVARIGGDEFAVLMPSVDSASTQLLTTDLLSALVAPIMIDGEPIRIGASCGTACWPVDGTSGEALLRQADLALYSRKSQARDKAA
jgi:diguanylate cyclase